MVLRCLLFWVLVYAVSVVACFIWFLSTLVWGLFPNAVWVGCLGFFVFALPFGLGRLPCYPCGFAGVILRYFSIVRILVCPFVQRG